MILLSQIPQIAKGVGCGEIASVWERLNDFATTGLVSVLHHRSLCSRDARLGKHHSVNLFFPREGSGHTTARW